MINRKRRVARALLSIDAIGFSPQEPVTFKSGIQSPVYVDNRKLPYHPHQWRVIMAAFQFILEAMGSQVDVIAGIAMGAVPHSSALAYTLQSPGVFIRKEAKGHGSQNRIEGGDVNGKHVVLIEDLVTTGGSSLSGVAALRDAGAIVEDCIAIVSYGFPKALDDFTDAGVRLYTLTDFPIILEEAAETDTFSAQELEIIHDWFHNPQGWAQRQGQHS